MSDEFDLLVNVRDSKTGRQTSSNPYRAFQRNGVRLYERPVGSGNLWYENQKVAGRVTINDAGVLSFDTQAPHQEWNPPLTEDQKLSIQLASQSQKIKVLEAEVAAAKVDRDTKVAPSPAKAKAKKVWTEGAKKESVKELD